MSLFDKVSATALWIWSYICGISVEKRNSRFNGLLEVRYDYGRYVLNSAEANYSFGTLHKVFQKTFGKAEIKKRIVENVLLLGFGTGSVVTIIREELKMQCKITAVEHDDVVIELGQKYFNTQQFNDFTLIQNDAFLFVKEETKKYTLIITDIFIDKEVPEQFQHPNFISKLCSIVSENGILFFNFIVESPASMKNFLHLKSIFSGEKEGKTDIFSVSPINKVIIWEKYRQTME